MATPFFQRHRGSLNQSSRVTRAVRHRRMTTILTTPPTKWPGLLPEHPGAIEQRPDPNRTPAPTSPPEELPVRTAGEPPLTRSRRNGNHGSGGPPGGGPTPGRGGRPGADADAHHPGDCATFPLPRPPGCPHPAPVLVSPLAVCATAVWSCMAFTPFVPYICGVYGIHGVYGVYTASVQRIRCIWCIYRRCIHGIHLGLASIVPLSHVCRPPSQHPHQEGGHVGVLSQVCVR